MPVTGLGLGFFKLTHYPIFERGLYHIIKAADDCVASYQLGDPETIELHGSPMYAGRDGIWRTVRDRTRREEYITRALSTLHGHRSIRLFAVIVDKAAASPRDPVSLAFEELCNRFNLFLTRINDRASQENGQRGLIVMDEMKHEKPLQMLARKYRVHGASWGHFRNLAEVPCSPIQKRPGQFNWPISLLGPRGADTNMEMVDFLTRSLGYSMRKAVSFTVWYTDTLERSTAIARVA